MSRHKRNGIIAASGTKSQQATACYVRSERQARRNLVSCGNALRQFHCGWMPAERMSFAHFAISVLICAANSSGLLPTGS